MSAGGSPRAVRDWWRELARRFTRARLVFGHGTANARDEAAWLLCHVLRIGFEDFASAQDRAVGAAAARRIDTLAARRIATRVPLAYVLREAWLQGHRFHVDSRVIVPRSHIAALLPDGIRAWTTSGGPRTVLDLCTGSGCLAILAARAYPRAHVVASDVSAAALAVARRNVAAYRLGQRVRLVRSDLFAALGPARFDLILCNPPYVPAREMRRLPPEYRHEPSLALGSGEDGLDFLRRLLAETHRHLARRGVLIVEVGDGRRAVERAFPRLPLTWLETSAGGGLVFAVSAPDLRVTV